MLTNLKISNYALIQNLDIDFTNGLSAITGQTGAGKSIIMGALSLVLGGRADSKVAFCEDEKCIVEATFEVSEYKLESLFDNLQVDYFSQTIVRREILPNGKSRAFINDTPVSLSQVKELSSMLIDIHSQHENLLLSNANFQLNIIDIISSTNSELEIYTNIFKSYTQKKHELKQLKEKALNIASEKEYAQYQFNQLQEAQLNADEQEMLEEELNIINHSQEIYDNLSNALQVFDNEQFGIVLQLKNAIQNIKKINKYFPKSDDFLDRLNSSLIDIEDITSEIENVLNSTEFSMERKLFLENRLNLIYSLQQKHRVDSIKQLLDIQCNFEKKLYLIENLDEEISSLNKEFLSTESDLIQSSKTLSNKRKSIKNILEERVKAMLVDLGMPSGLFEVSFSATSDFSLNGNDRVEFLFSANKNKPPQPVAQIASGGEISRLMLIIKSLIASSKALPTIIFDEIDTGVSGEIAIKMGEIMKKMADNMQVIAITHLPQIAAKGDSHYKVFKDELQDSTHTNITKLNADESIMEIAEMIAGNNPSQAVINSAKEMLKR